MYCDPTPLTMNEENGRFHAIELTNMDKKLGTVGDNLMGTKM